MQLGKYISDLLYHHDQVILPGFGAFSTRYVPAKFIPEKKIVESPTKVAEFSPEPSTGSTPLIAYMAEKEGRSIDWINDFLKKLVKEIVTSIESGNKVEFEYLGVFQLDADGLLQFIPDPKVNYLKEDTGLSQVKAPEQKEMEADIKPPPVSPAKEKATIPEAEPPAAAKKTIKKQKEKTEYTHTNTPDPMKITMPKLPPALKWLAYVIIPLLVILIILFLNFNFFFGEGGLFRTGERPVVELPPAEPTPPAITETPVEPPAEVVETEPVEVANPLPAEPEPVAAPAKPEPGRKTYYIVVGSFRNERNAIRLAENLRNQGAHQAQVFMRTPSDFHRVCYAFYYDLAEAEAAKARIPAEFREIAWILHR